MTHKFKHSFITKVHLVISVLIVIPVAFIYGFAPELLFDIYLNTIDEYNAFKAVMGLYIGFSVLWILGIFKNQFLRIALITNVIFMLGLGFGRFLSLLLDGMPTRTFIFGTFGELILGIYGIWVLSKYYKKV